MADPFSWLLNNVGTPLFRWTISVCQHNICPPFHRCLRDIFQSFQSNGGSGNSGKQSSTGYMLFASDLDIKNMNDANCWILVGQNESRYKDVAELKNVCWLEINARINFRKLSPNTNYAAYIIFKTTPQSIGLNITQVASVNVDGEQPQPPKSVCLKPTKDTPRDGSIGLPVEKNGWMELELGQFKCDNITGDKEAEISIKEINDLSKEKKGLIVAGIEVRPI